MKKSVIMIGMVVVVLAAFVGAAVAAEMSGTVTEVNAHHNTIKIKNEKIEAGFDCETGSMIAGIKVGENVTVEYTEAGGKKKATKITPAAATKKQAPVGC